MNVLHNLDNSNLGGIQELIFNLHKHSRHTHDFWAADGSMAPILRQGGMVLWPHGPPDEAHYDVVVAHGVGGWSCDNVTDWAHARGAKCIEVMHSIHPSLSTPSKLDGFIALSHLAAAECRGMPKLQVIYGMVESRLFNWRDPQYIGRMSRLVAEKRPWEFAQLARQFPNEKFVLGGDGPERSRISTTDNLFLVGTVRNFAEFFGRMKLFVYPTQEECCCMTVAMAQTAGVPVVCQDLPALRETTGGFAVFCRSANDFQQAVHNYLAYPDPYEAMAVEARSWAWRNFAETNVALAWDSYLECL